MIDCDAPEPLLPCCIEFEWWGSREYPSPIDNRFAIECGPGVCESYHGEFRAQLKHHGLAIAYIDSRSGSTSHALASTLDSMRAISSASRSSLPVLEHAVELLRGTGGECAAAAKP